MRSVVLVAYDVADDKRRAKVFAKLKGYGQAVQYSVFRCTVSANDRVRLRADLWDLIDHTADRVLVADLGPADGRVAGGVEFWGRPPDDPVLVGGPLIV